MKKDMENIEQIKLILRYIRFLFSRIRNDWSDPRWECREGWEAVDRLLELLGEKLEKPYRHIKDLSLDEYLKGVKENLNKELN